MRLRHRLFAVAALVVLVAIAFGGTSYILLRQYQSALYKERISNQIAFEVLQRRLLAGDYLLYPTERAKAQWQIRQQTVEQLIQGNLQIFASEKEKAYTLIIQQNTADTRENFDELVKVSESNQNVISDQATALSSLLSFNAQSAVTNATELQEINQHEAATALSRLIMLFSLAGTIFLAVLASGFKYIWHSAEELEKLDQTKDEFVSLASHQLRTPLTSIMLYSGMLADGYGGKLKSKQQELLDVVLFSTDRMRELVRVLLNIARVEAGRVTIQPKATDLHQVLKDILDEQKPKAAEKNITLIDTTTARIPIIHTDQNLLKELYTNPISNAIKYTPPKGTVTVKLELKDKMVFASVQDTGYGIPKREQRKIFTKFYRGTNIAKKEVVGTGLGLYLFKLVAENLGGEVGFTSTENKGSKFWFTLPLAGGPSRTGNTELEHTKGVA